MKQEWRVDRENRAKNRRAAGVPAGLRSTGAERLPMDAACAWVKNRRTPSSRESCGPHCLRRYSSWYTEASERLLHTAPRIRLAIQISLPRNDPVPFAASATASVTTVERIALSFSDRS